MRFQLNFGTSHPLPPFLEGGGKSAPPPGALKNQKRPGLIGLRHKNSFYFQSDQWSVTIFAFQRHQWMPSEENVWTCNKVIGELLCLFFLVKPPRARRRPHLLSSPRTTCHLQIRTLGVSQLGSTLKRVMASTAIDKKGQTFFSSQAQNKLLVQKRPRWQLCAKMCNFLAYITIYFGWFGRFYILLCVALAQLIVLGV